MDRDRHGLTLGHDYIYHEWCRLGDVTKGYTIAVNAWPIPRPQSVTRDAGTIAGLDVKRIINEPTAAALAYSMEKKREGHIVASAFASASFTFVSSSATFSCHSF